MHTILSTLVAVTVLSTTAFADTRVNPFTDPSLALPRSERVINDEHEQALPRLGYVDPFTDPSLPLPLTDETFPDIVIATP